ncbi:hypothetical protein AQ484_14450 [Acinetobacter baumannii]|nr:hypothetical protein AQ484_14450 [Acinetobacter baumannii]
MKLIWCKNPIATLSSNDGRDADWQHYYVFLEHFFKLLIELTHLTIMFNNVRRQIINRETINTRYGNLELVSRSFTVEPIKFTPPNRVKIIEAKIPKIEI